MKKKFLSKLLTMLLVVSMMFTMLPASAIAYYDGGWSGWRNSWWDSWWNDSEDVTADEQAAEMEIATQAVDNSEFLRIFHLDCGRKYFSKEQIYGIIDELAKNHYTHIELAFGNEGLRFVLNKENMAVGNYSGSKVVAAIASGNQTYDSAQWLNYTVDAWTEDDMNAILDYAKGKDIEVIPMFDIPGHMNAVISAMKTLDIDVDVFSQVGKKYPGNIGQSFDPTNEEAVAFAKGLVENYISYFAGKECKYFNIAGDECGFAEMNSTQYDAYIQLMNDLNTSVKAKGMTTMMFNDGVYYKGKNVKGYTGQFDKDIVICYWTGGDNYQTSTVLQEEGFKLINTNVHWYYAAGNEYTNSNKMFYYNYAIKNMESKKCTECDGGGAIADTGCMLAFWCDNPTEDVNTTNLKTYIKTLADNNPNYFKASTRVDPEQLTLTLGSSSLAVGKSTTVTANKDVVTWASDDEEVATIVPDDSNAKLATLTAVGEGATTITATATDESTATVGIAVTAGDVTYDERPIEIVQGLTATDTIKGANYSGDYVTKDPGVAIVVSAGYKKVDGKKSFAESSSLINGQKYYFRNTSGQYLSADATWVSDINDAEEWTYIVKNTTYRLQNTSGEYLQYNNDDWETSDDGRLYYNSIDGALYGKRTLSWNSSSSGFAYNYYNPVGTPGTLQAGESVDATEVTFKGVSKGTTYVTIGNVHYTIHVSEEDLSNAPTLPIQLWITNNSIKLENDDGYTTTPTEGNFCNNVNNHADHSGENHKAQYLTIKAKDIFESGRVNSVDGVSLSECVPTIIKARYENNGTRWPSKQGTDEKEPYDLVLCKGTVLRSGHLQKIWDDSEIKNGVTDFNFVRYLEGKWQVSLDRTEDSWVTVTGKGSTGIVTTCTEQIVAYYYMQTKLTDEVTTNVVDWGDPYEGSLSSNKVLLDFAVNIGTSGRDPELSEFPINNKTLVYHCDSTKTSCVTKDANGNLYRRIDEISVMNTGNYEVYMITLKPTSDNPKKTLSSSPRSIYDNEDGTEQVVWVIDSDALERSAFNDSSKWYTGPIPSGETEPTTKFDPDDTTGRYVGGDAVIPRVDIYNGQGMLVTYYLRSKAETKLTVHYIDQKKNEQFHEIEVPVASNTYFDPNFGMNDDGTLHDATVKSDKNKDFTVEPNLKELPQIEAKYRRVKYKLVKADLDGITEKATDAYLYYTFDNTESFVVDFGLPLTIEPADVGNLKDAEITKAEVSGVNTKQAEVMVTQAGVVTYKLLKPLGENPDTFTVAYTGKGVDGSKEESATVEFMFYIYPASNVLYEGNFLKEIVDSDTPWTLGTSSGSDIQSSDQTVRYGYDAAYKTSTGSLKSNWEIEVPNANTTSRFLTTSFYGTGFDLIGSAGPNTGYIFMWLSGNGVETLYIVDTSYVGGDGKTTLYQVPLVHREGLEEGTYTVKILGGYRAETAATSSAATYSMSGSANATDSIYAVLDKFYEAGYDFDDVEMIYFDQSEAQTGTYNAPAVYANYAIDTMADAATASRPEGTKVVIDGFRVYRSSNNSAYLEAEQNVRYQNILEAVSGTIYAYTERADKDIEVSADKYEASGGPKKEIYLSAENRKAIVFGVTGASTVQVSLRAVGAEDVTVKSGNESLTIGTNTEMYYELPVVDGEVSILNNSNGMLAIGNVKIPSGGAITTVTTEEAEQALRLALYASPDDPNPTAFDPFVDVSVKSVPVIRNKLVTLTVTTTTDVTELKVNGKTLRPTNSWMVKMGWSDTYTYVLVDTVRRNEIKDYEIIASNAAGDSCVWNGQG